MSDDNENGIFESEYYFSLSDAAKDVSFAYGAKETTVAGAKLVGKTVFNTALFSGKVGLEIIKRLPEFMAQKIEKKG